MSAAMGEKRVPSMIPAICSPQFLTDFWQTHAIQQRYEIQAWSRSHGSNCHECWGNELIYLNILNDESSSSKVNSSAARLKSQTRIESLYQKPSSEYGDSRSSEELKGCSYELVTARSLPSESLICFLVSRWIWRVRERERDQRDPRKVETGQRGLQYQVRSVELWKPSDQFEWKKQSQY